MKKSLFQIAFNPLLVHGTSKNPKNPNFGYTRPITILDVIFTYGIVMMMWWRERFFYIDGKVIDEVNAWTLSQCPTQRNEGFGDTTHMHK